jgi:hypothetical protein
VLLPGQPSVSDRQGQLLERDRRPPIHRLLNRQFVMSSADVFREGMPGDHDPALRSCLSPRIGRRRAFNRPWSASMWLFAYWSARCQAAGASSSTTLVHRRVVGDDLDRADLGRADGLLEEPSGCLEVAVRGDDHLEDLAELVSRTIDVAPLARDLHVGLVDLPAITDGVPARPSGISEQRREPLHPPVDGDVVDLNATLGEQLPQRRDRTARSGGTSGLR